MCPLPRVPGGSTQPGRVLTGYSLGFISVTLNLQGRQETAVPEYGTFMLVYAQSIYLYTNRVWCCFVYSGWRIRGSRNSGVEEDPGHGKQIQAATNGGSWGRPTHKQMVACAHVFDVTTCTGLTACLSPPCSVPVRHQKWWWLTGPSTKRSAATWRKTNAWYSWIQVKKKKRRRNSKAIWSKKGSYRNVSFNSSSLLCVFL